MSEIKSGQKTTLIFKTEDGSTKELNCLVKEFFVDRLSLRFPPETMDYIDYLLEGEEVFVKIFTPLGVKAFDAVILDSPLEQDFVIEYVENPMEIQRREYARVFLQLKVILETSKGEKIIGTTIDVSGGGLKFLYEGTIEPEQIVNITLYMPEARSIQSKGVIIQNNHIPENEHVLAFTDIDEKERDRLIKHCFEVQLANN